MAKLILTHEVERLGVAGDVVEVKDGYARNYLLPRKLATPWTKGAQRQIDQMTAARRKREIASVEDARAVRDALQAAAFVTVTRRASDTGHLYGAVSTADIAEAVKNDLGQTIDRRKVVIGNPIKVAGDYQVGVRLHPEVDAKIKVRVTAA